MSVTRCDEHKRQFVLRGLHAVCYLDPQPLRTWCETRQRHVGLDRVVVSTSGSLFATMVRRRSL